MKSRRRRNEEELEEGTSISVLGQVRRIESLTSDKCFHGVHSLMNLDYIRTVTRRGQLRAQWRAVALRFALEHSGLP
jgi:hypothetical protein